MERRTDYRHALRYDLSLKCPRTGRVLDHLATDDVSASGLRFAATEPHGLHVGDALEVQLVALLGPKAAETHLVMATRAVVVRAGACDAALRFEAPLAY